MVCVWCETKARNPSLFAPQAFLRKSLGHSHFAIVWLVCSTKCKQATNTKGKECGSIVSSRFFGEHCMTSQKTAAKETLIIYVFVSSKSSSDFCFDLLDLQNHLNIRLNQVVEIEIVCRKFDVTSSFCYPFCSCYYFYFCCIWNSFRPVYPSLLHRELPFEIYFGSYCVISLQYRNKPLICNTLGQIWCVLILTYLFALLNNHPLHLIPLLNCHNFLHSLAAKCQTWPISTLWRFCWLRFVQA